MRQLKNILNNIIMIMFAISIFGCSHNTDTKSTNKLNKLLSETSEIQRLKLSIIEKEDAYWYTNQFPGRLGLYIYKGTISYYENGLFASQIQYHAIDKEYIVMACKDSEIKNFYLCIFEKSYTNYVYKNLIKLGFMFYIDPLRTKNEITVAYQYATDWMDIIIWDGVELRIKPQNEYGP